MRIFVPRRRYNAAPDRRAQINWTYTEIVESDLPAVVKQWRDLGQTPHDGDKVSYFHSRAKDVCAKASRNETFIEFMLRPHITVHAGAKEGRPEHKQRLHDVAYTAGRLVALHGFSIWNGGGVGGPMGASIAGFNDGIRELGGPLPGQCSVQIIPANFALPPQEKERPGFGIPNEGLSHVTDAALITVDFATRRELLDNICTAAISCPGGSGTLDEATDVGVHAKTGLRNISLYMVNTPFPELGDPLSPGSMCGYYDHFKAQIERAIELGTESPSTREVFQFVDTPEEAFANLMPRLEAVGQMPDAIYEENCKLFGFDPAFRDKILPMCPDARPSTGTPVPTLAAG